MIFPLGCSNAETRKYLMIILNKGDRPLNLFFHSAQLVPGGALLASSRTCISLHFSQTLGVDCTLSPYYKNQT